MSYSIVGKQIFYHEYIVGHEFVEDIKSTNRDLAQQ